MTIEEYILEAKTDCYEKDRLFLASFAFCVIPFEPIMIQTCSAPQNDRLNFSFVKDITVVVKKMTRNHHEMIGKTAVSLLCPLHSIQLSPLVFLPLCMQYDIHKNFIIAFLSFKFGMIVVVFDALIWHSWTNAMEPEDIMTSAKGKFFLCYFTICFPNL